tara:strand:- start:7072 stop:7983 length:912 start_codon:yes stop_codon:yes gene_type:complete
MVANISNIEKGILDIKYGRVKEGLCMGIPEIDEYIRYKQGNFNLIIGHANVGKTTIIAYLFTVWAIKHNLRFLIWSSENTSHSIVRKIIEFKMCKPIQKASEDEIKKEIDWCNKYFKIIEVSELVTYKELLQEADDIKKAWDYHSLLIDPYNSLSKDYNLLKKVGGHEYDYQVASEFRLFAKKRNITIFLNAHGVTEALRKVHPKGHEYEGLPQPLGLASVEGGGKWGNRADDVLSIHRMTSHPTEWMYTQILVLKVKEQETGGRCTPYDAPIRLKMKNNNVGFDHIGRDLIKYKATEKQINF